MADAPTPWPKERLLAGDESGPLEFGSGAASSVGLHGTSVRSYPEVDRRDPNGADAVDYSRSALLANRLWPAINNSRPRSARGGPGAQRLAPSWAGSQRPYSLPVTHIGPQPRRVMVAHGRIASASLTSFFAGPHRGR